MTKFFKVFSRFLARVGKLEKQDYERRERIRRISQVLDENAKTVTLSRTRAEKVMNS